MKKRRINPRTGIVGIGIPRPQRPPPSIPRSSQQITYPGPVFDMDKFESIAEKVGHIIAKEINKEISSIGSITTQQDRHSNKNFVNSSRKSAKKGISIDESLIDVGIGRMDELKKGEGSTELAKADIKQDKGLKASKNKLKKLKKGLI